MRRPPSPSSKVLTVTPCRTARACGLWIALVAGLLLGLASAGADTTPAPDLASLEQAAAALAEGRLTAAADGFAGLARLQPDDPRPVLGLSAVAEARGEVLEALTLARQAATLDPENAEAHFASARLLVRLGAPKEALDALTTVRRLEPKASRGYLLAALVLRDVQQHEAAADLLDRARWTPKRPQGLDDPRIDHQLALLWLSLDRVEAARQLTTQALERHPDDAGLYLAHGLALAQSDGDATGEAVAALERALDLGVDDAVRVRFELGTLLFESGNPEAALPHLEAAAQAGLPEAYYRLGLTRRALGDADGARHALERFQALSQERDRAEHADKDRGTTLNTIQSLASANRLDEALTALDTLLAEQPEDGRAHALRGKLLFSKGEIDGAIASITRARELLPAYAEHHYLEGYFLLHRGKLEPAAIALQRALAIDASLARAHALLAGLAAETGDLEAAAEGFERAFALGLKDPAFEAVYRKVLEHLGRTPG